MFVFTNFVNDIYTLVLKTKFMATLGIEIYNTKNIYYLSRYLPNINNECNKSTKCID